MRIDAQSTQDADAVAERFTGAFTETFMIDGHPLKLGASIGRAIYPTNATNAESLIRYADTKMYETKLSSG